VRLSAIPALLLIAAAIALPAQEPYKEMLDDELSFTGAETLETDPDAPIIIGLFAPDDEDHPVGRALTRGAELAVAEANAAGGVGGRPIRLVRRWADDPWGAGSKEVIRLVFEDRAWALIGGPDGASTHVAQQVATKAHILLIAPVSSDPSLTHTRVPWIFRLPPDDAAQAEVLVEEAIVPLGIERIGIVTSTDHDGRTAAGEFLTALERTGRPAIFHLEIDAMEAEPEEVATRVASFRPDGLILRLPPKAVRAVAAAVSPKNPNLPIFSPWIPGLDLREFPLEGVRNAYWTAPFASPLSCRPGLKFTRTYIAAYGDRPPPSAAFGHDAAAIIIKAFRSGADHRVDLRDAIADLTDWSGTTGVLEWDTGGGNTATPSIERNGPVESDRAITPPHRNR